ncbi:MAG TPA: nitrite reductase large subunit NirB [Polyangiaceae bacterium]|nr:nitrite reductase large subunit NirB [Polyangiaceae bacterium]
MSSITNGTGSPKRRLCVVGNGMVGHHFVKEAIARGLGRTFAITVIAEENDLAYDRVNLSKWFDGKKREELSLVEPGEYERMGVEVLRGDPVVALERDARRVRTASGRVVGYDKLVLATGSSPFVPEIPGRHLEGCFVYRTLENLAAIREAAQRSTTGAVIGGGLLGLEAANALRALGLETHVVEMAPRLMPLQVDDVGAALLRERIEELGVTVHLGTTTREVLADESSRVRALRFADGRELTVGLVVFSAGIRPRDELARRAGLDVGERGGIVIDGSCHTSDPDVFAIGECAAFEGRTYGLVAPGYRMAETAADALGGGTQSIDGFDMSTKLKLLGVDVGSFGDAFARAPGAKVMSLCDSGAGVYKKLVLSADKKRLLGGMLVGDASDYASLVGYLRAGSPVPDPPEQLLFANLGVGNATGLGVDMLPEAAAVCSCHNVDKRTICSAIRERRLTQVGEVKSCTKAGTGCGSCVTLLAELLKSELKRAGVIVPNHLCEHFAHSRQELFHLVRVHGIRSFDQLIAQYGHGEGCEICQPAVASILASNWNEHVLDTNHVGQQDTNDRFLANIQRDGTYSVVPRLAAGEVTPDQLIALGRIAKKYALYTKITGGQRVDMFGARREQLPAIWRELGAAGFESGHAYGKALRTVKSCVGSTWCRYGVQDSVGFAIRVENRYKGLRSPHKLKGAVSGCARECAEAQSKDFGIIATDKGYNLYVCGNGGMKPQHAVLLASDLDESTLIRYLDRFLMFYVRTADRLQRTASWLNGLEGGIEYLERVIVRDELGIGAELEAAMERVVGSYQCEWKAALADPQKLQAFRAFVNSETDDPSIVFVKERAQHRPAFWPEKRSLLDERRVRLPVLTR